LNDISAHPLVRSPYRETKKDLRACEKVEKLTEDLLEVARTFKINKYLNKDEKTNN
jgi:DNA-binding transcriptional regulator GbsR (MarR family)